MKHYIILLLLIFLLLISLVLNSSLFSTQLISLPFGTSESSRYKVIGCLVEDCKSYGDRIRSKLCLSSISTSNLTGEAKGSLEILVNKQKQRLFSGAIVSCNLQIYEKDIYLKSSISNIKFIYYKNSYYRYRAELLTSLYQRFGSLGEPGSLLSALLLGNKIGLEEVNRYFREAGISHLLALSGFHTALLAAILSIIVTPLLGKKRASVLISILLFLYLLLTGFSASLIRAVLMYFLYTLFLLFNQKVEIKKIVLYSMLIQLIICPGHFLDLSFQFSYLAIWGIVILTPIFNLYLLKILPSIISTPLAVSISAQWILSPLLLIYFGTLSPFAIIASLVVTPLITLFIWIGLLEIVVVNIPIFNFIIYLNGVNYKLIIDTILWLSKLPKINCVSFTNRLLLSLLVLLPLFALIIYNKNKITQNIRGLSIERKRIQFKL